MSQGPDDPLRRRRRLAAWVLAGAGGALGLGAVLAARGKAALAPAPVSLPHREHAVACAGCHSRKEAPAAACTTCHEPHPSQRKAHAALARNGSLTCTTCHPAHGGEGVVLEVNGDAVRWKDGHEERIASLGAPRERRVHVPTVATTACAKCHSPGDPKDPAARCFGASSSLCFDEHATPAPGRFTAWTTAARVIRRAPKAPTPSTVTRSERARPTDLAAVLVPLVAAGTATTLGLVALRPRRRSKPPRNPPPSPPRVRRLPVIDPTTCLGCNACVDACPFDVLTLERFVAKVARPDACCGVVSCAEVCPNGSLTIAEGEALPGAWRLDPHLESRDREGLYLAGDVSGVPLLKNAVDQGVRVAERVAARLGKSHDRGNRQDGTIDFAIVGAGPAGLSAGLRAQALGLSVVVLEQATLAASIAGFPRGKIVQDAPIELPVAGEPVLADCTKEELLLRWQRLVRTAHLDVREGNRVVGVAGVDGTPARYRLQTSTGSTLDARAVLFAVGRRGTPRTLDVPVAPGASVYHALIDARTFAGARVVIVGLGDVAMEAAVALADQPGTTVTLLARAESFRRGRARNVDAVTTRSERGALELVFSATVTHIDRGRVRAATPQGDRDFACDHVFLLLGGEVAANLLEGAGMTRESTAEGRPRIGEPSV